MSVDFTDGLDYVLEDAGGVDVSYGSGISGHGILDEVEEVELETGRVLGMRRVVIVRTSTFPGLQNDSAITVGGVSYTIRDHERIDEGALTRIQLAGG